jgi:hypothetical protein
MNPIMDALQKFEASEANLAKLERLWEELKALFPAGLTLDENPEYEDRSRSFKVVLTALPKIDGWRPTITPPSIEGLAQSRLDFMELGDPLAEAQFEASLWADGRELHEYRFRLNQKRRALIRDALVDVIDQIDADLRAIREEVGEPKPYENIASPIWDQLRAHVDQVEVLLGSSVSPPPRWRDLNRHLSFRQAGDLHDIEVHDWPAVKAGLRNGLYGVNEPVPVEVDDLAGLVASKPRGPITTALRWSNLDDDGFERLLFTLISDEPGYENPEWLMRTRAPDRGRDLSVTRVTTDGLSGTLRQRIVIQCKHWLTKSIALPEVSTAKEQTTLWPDPRVDVLIVATSGRFTADAVQWIERHNAGGAPPRIEMWPESHLERLLAARPALIAEFRLRYRP